MRGRDESRPVWTPAEDAALLAVVADLRAGGRMSWPNASAAMKERGFARTAAGCHSRYFDIPGADPSVRRPPVGRAVSAHDARALAQAGRTPESVAPERIAAGLSQPLPAGHPISWGALSALLAFEAADHAA